MFTEGKRFTLPKQCFTQDLSCASHSIPLSFFKKSEVLCRSACPAIARRATADCRGSRCEFCKRRQGSREQASKKIPPSGGITNTTTRLSGVQPDDRRTASRPRSDIAPLSASFASEARGERTCVRDPSCKRRKARGSKRDRSVLFFILS